MNSPRRRPWAFLYALIAAVVVTTVLSCLAFAHRDLLLVHYHSAVYVNPSSTNVESELWLSRHPALSVPLLVKTLQQDNAVACERAGRLLEEICDAHPDPTDPEHAQLSLNMASMLYKQFEIFSNPGKIQSVNLAFLILEQHLGRWSPNVATALATAGETVLLALKDPNLSVQYAALEQLPQAWHWNGTDIVAQTLAREWMCRWQARAVDRLHSESPKVRAVAARALEGAVTHTGDTELLKLLHDPDIEVCRAAMKTIYANEIDNMGEENRYQLIELLDHQDDEVRELAKKILLAYGLSEQRVRVVSLMRQSAPEERAKAAEAIVSLEGVDRVSALDELARDASPIVRLAAVKAASKIDNPTLHDMIKQLSIDDPDVSVREACQAAMEPANSRRF